MFCFMVVEAVQLGWSFRVRTDLAFFFAHRAFETVAPRQIIWTCQEKNRELRLEREREIPGRCAKRSAYVGRIYIVMSIIGSCLEVY